MEINTSRILIETVLRQSLKELKSSPERKIRNLIDLGLNFSKGRFQQLFFEAAQEMLQNEHSSYYDLIEHVVKNVDSEKLISLGMNIGYNSCTYGAKIIRKIEAEQNFNIPWSVSLHIDEHIFNSYVNRYSEIILEGNELGIYTWQIFLTEFPYDLIPLMKMHEDNAFILFCGKKCINTTLIDHLQDLNNIMLVIQYEEDISETCRLLRRQKFPYSIYYPYNDSDMEYITSGKLFGQLELFYPVFIILLCNPNCKEQVHQTIYDYVVHSRNKQLYQAIPWENTYDNRRIDTIISEDACSVDFDIQGHLCYLSENHKINNNSLLNHSLLSLLKDVFPKQPQ